MNLLIEPQFLPPIEYFSLLTKHEEVVLDVHHHFEKQTYRNRCYIRGANKIERLSVPVTAANHTSFRSVEIDNTAKWSIIMWRSLQSAYANAPFFLFYKDQFEKIFQKRFTHLLDLDVELMTLCLKLLNFDIKLKFTEAYHSAPKGNYNDHRSIISPKQRYSSRPFYEPVEYPQLFGSNFEANLSIIDLIFCEGPNAQSIVTKSAR